MKQYRPGRPGRPRPRRRAGVKFHFGKSTFLLICVSVAVVLVAIVLLNANGGTKEIDPTDTFADNVTVQGIAVGGMTASEARVALNPTMKEMMAEAVIQISVPSLDLEDGEEQDGKEEEAASSAMPQTGDSTRVVEYTATQAGVSVDVDSALQQAMEYSVNEAPRKAEDAPIKDFTMLYVLDESTLTDSLNRDAADWVVPAQNATYVLETDNDESALTTSAEPVKKDGVLGEQVDVAALAQEVQTMVTSQNFGLIEAPVVALQPEITADQLPELEVIGRYSTHYSSSSDARMYNIWKISSILNGQTIEPGIPCLSTMWLGPGRKKADGRLHRALKTAYIPIRPEAGSARFHPLYILLRSKRN